MGPWWGGGGSFRGFPESRGLVSLLSLFLFCCLVHIRTGIGIFWRNSLIAGLEMNSCIYSFPRLDFGISVILPDLGTMPYQGFPCGVALSLLTHLESCHEQFLLCYCNTCSDFAFPPSSPYQHGLMFYGLLL